MNTSWFEAMEDRQLLSAAPVLAPAPAAATVVMADTPATSTPVLGRAYYGTYKIGPAATKLNFELVKAYGGSVSNLFAASVSVAGVQYAGNLVVSSTGLTLSWFTYDDVTSEQIVQGTIQGKLSADGKKITGKATVNGLTGTASLKQNVPSAEVESYNYSGKYTINGVTRKIAIKLVKGYGHGIFYIQVLDNTKTFDGNMYTVNGQTYINWFRYDNNYGQINLGSIACTFSADGNTLEGTVTQGKKTGTVMMSKPGVAPSQL